MSSKAKVAKVIIRELEKLPFEDRQKVLDAVYALIDDEDGDEPSVPVDDEDGDEPSVPVEPVP